ncbi:4Fe-4S single cluster domain-containing protein [Persephonella sp. KM09-Lau-8]|uniref:4Fe-4S single cluster domain-containing protein n=1 Tax=Persephonella sp. KM09-Lau-8 TaxID=1158345 RepID=UPI00068D3341|nr:4Fe-4S single cluster domain-containing protein [Persephonella sp. KM09-Lau-8]
MKVARILYPVKTLGPGNRVGVWLQGCSIRCRGCMSVETWSFEDGIKEDPILLAKKLSKISNSFTISGGEPFDQPKELKKFLEELKKEGIEDIIIYTGYTEEKVLEDFPWTKKLCSLLISGPFIAGLETESGWKGSENQKAKVFNKKFKDYYRQFLESKKQPLQILGGTIVGIPSKKQLINTYMGIKS